jgi:hypothetical protein
MSRNLFGKFNIEVLAFDRDLHSMSSHSGRQKTREGESKRRWNYFHYNLLL